MNELNALDQNYLFASSRLFIQLSFLIAGVCVALNILKTLRAFQEQIGALLKLSITGATSDRSVSTSSAAPSLAESSPYWLAPSGSETAAPPQLAERGPNRIVVARRKMVLWLQAPMTSTQPAPWRRIVSWLQAPAGT
jgi:hypothetical protein